MSKFRPLTAPCFGVLVAGAMIAGARASDLTITSTFSDVTEYNDNFLLKNGPASGVIGNYSTVTLLGVKRTPTTSLEFGGNLSYRKYFGPGASDLTFSENTSDGLNFRFEKSGNLQADKDYIAASYRRSDAALAQRQDIGVFSTTIRGDLITYAAQGGGSRQVSALDTINWNGSVTTTAYSPSNSGGTPFTNYLVGGSWARRISQVIDFVASSDMTWLLYDDTNQTRTTIFRSTGGIRAKLSSRLTLTANGGATLVNTEQDRPGGAAAATVFDPITGLPINVVPTSGSSLGPVWDAAITYKWDNTTNMNLSVSQSVSPGAIGSVSTRKIITANISHQINSISDLNFAANVTRFEQGGTSPVSDVYNFSTAYTYRFTRDLRANLLYNYRLRNVPDSATAPGGSASANSVILTISQDATLKP